MAQTQRELETDLARLQEMLVDARAAGNEDTEDILTQAEARIESAIMQFTKDSRATRQATIDSATTELIAFENEARVSRELKAAIQNSRGDLVRRRESA